MTDSADTAALLTDAYIERRVRAAIVPVPAGAAGECARCFEPSARLIDGRCAPCRDGRWRA